MFIISQVNKDASKPEFDHLADEYRKNFLLLLCLFPFNGSDTLFNMEKRVLVISGYQVFAELMQLALVEDNLYQVDVPETKEEVVSLAGDKHYDLVILDADQPLEPIETSIETLNLYQPLSKLIVFPPGNDPDHPTLEKYKVDVYLTKPFYRPELLARLAELTVAKQQEEAVKKEDGDRPALEIWNNQDLANQILQNVLDEYEPVAVMIWRYGQLFAYQGRLEENAAQKVSALLLHDWDKKSQNDIVRYKNFTEAGEVYLIYVTALENDGILVMLYPKNKSLTMVRTHTLSVVEKLHNPTITFEYAEQLNENEEGVENGIDRVLSAVEQESLPWETDEQLETVELISKDDQIDEQPDEQEMIRVQELMSESDSSEGESHAIHEPLASEWSVEQVDQEVTDEAHGETDSREDILAGLIFPWDAAYKEPKGSETETETEPEIKAETETDLETEGETTAEAEEEYDFQEGIQAESEIHKEDVFDLQEAQPVEQESQKTEPEPSLEVTQPVQPQPVESRSTTWREPAVNQMEDTVPRKIQPFSVGFSAMEPFEPGYSNLNYTFVLLPRIPEHYLTGIVSNKLSRWIPQLCLAYAWRLDRISVRPQYLQWSLQVSPTYSPGHLVRVIREETSSRIFKLRPEFQEENLSDDFWAPGFMALSGYLPPTREIVFDFIKQTRTRQGLVR